MQQNTLNVCETCKDSLNVSVNEPWEMKWTLRQLL